jgi:hypothetical protein
MNVRSPVLLLGIATCFSGCLLVRTTEQRITLNADGSGQAFMRLIDIRSDGTVDSIITRDFGIMMASADSEGVKEFEQAGRKVLTKQFVVTGDTLIMDISYSFPRLESIDGMKQNDDEVFVVVNKGREIVKTNGEIQSWENDSQRIVWPAKTKRLMFVIRERQLPPSTSLARLYRKYRKISPGENP